jgi:hypothetical protein
MEIIRQLFSNDDPLVQTEVQESAPFISTIKFERGGSLRDRRPRQAIVSD